MFSKSLTTIFKGRTQALVAQPYRTLSTTYNPSSQSPSLHSQVNGTTLSQEKKVHIIGYPFAGGQGKSGPELSPGWLFRQDWLQSLEENAGVSVEMVAVSNPKPNSANDKDIIQGHHPGRKNWNNVLNSSQRLERSTERALKHNLFPIVFGGDHSQAIGSINGLKKVYPGARVLWIDAHIDANTPSSSPSSNMHGMPVATLAGLVPQYGKKPVLSLKHLIYFGIRSYEPEEI